MKLKEMRTIWFASLLVYGIVHESMLSQGITILEL